MIRLLFLIGALNRGGAERQLTLLVKGIDRTRFAVTVVTVADGGALREEIAALDGVAVISLRKRGRWDVLAPLWRLAQVTRRVKPDVVHGYLDVPNILAVVVGKPARARVVWGLRASNVDFALYGRRSAWIHYLAARLSRFSDLIVANSHAGKQHHVSQGFRGERMLVIPNGFDTERFQPDLEAGRGMRRAWGIAESEPLIGLVARLDPIKDHRTFLLAAALLVRERRDVHFVCVGDGPGSYRHELQLLAEDLGLGDHLVWAGELNDMRAVYNALDVGTSSSLSEGFPNTIGEAMACGVPCVVTDVGDSAVLVGETGHVVPRGAPEAMTAAWVRLLHMSFADRTALGQRARDRIISEYSTQQLVRRTEAALAGLASQADKTSPLPANFELTSMPTAQTSLFGRPRETSSRRRGQ
jgi:glycosyltransferase involved in cell wall biosynthesis